MPGEARRNLHVPLPEDLYRRLRAEAARTRRPATELARDAIDRWLTEARRLAVHEEIAASATRTAGSRDDLDPDLEAAGLHHLLAAPPKTPTKRKNRR